MCVSVCVSVSVSFNFGLSRSQSLCGMLECIVCCGESGCSVVLVIVLHHAFDVEQFVSQPAALCLLSLVVGRLQTQHRKAR